MSGYKAPLGTGLSADQTTVRAYDEANNRHRVDAQVTATIGTVDVAIDATSDNIAIRDSDGNELNVNPNGSVNVVVQDITLDFTNDSVTAAIKQSNGNAITSTDPLPVAVFETGYTSVYRFAAINAVAMNVETTIVSYTVPLGKTANIEFSEMSGTNIGTFNLYVGATLINRKRTFFGRLNESMEFSNKGYALVAGDVVTLKVIHARPFNGNFEANLQIKESV